MKIINFIKQDILETRSSFIINAIIVFILGTVVVNFLFPYMVSIKYVAVWKLVYCMALISVVQANESINFWRRGAFETLEIAKAKNDILSNIREELEKKVKEQDLKVAKSKKTK